MKYKYKDQISIGLILFSGLMFWLSLYAGAEPVAVLRWIFWPSGIALVLVAALEVHMRQQVRSRWMVMTLFLLACAAIWRSWWPVSDHILLGIPASTVNIGSLVGSASAAAAWHGSTFAREVILNGLLFGALASAFAHFWLHGRELVEGVREEELVKQMLRNVVILEDGQLKTFVRPAEDENFKEALRANDCLVLNDLPQDEVMLVLQRTGLLGQAHQHQAVSP